MQKLSKKVATATSVAQVSLTAVLDAVVFDNGATGAELKGASDKYAQTEQARFDAGLQRARLVLEFKRKFNCPLGELRDELADAFGEDQITWGMVCMDRGFSGKTAKEAGNHARKTTDIAQAEEAYATANKMTLLAVQAKFRKQHPTITSTRKYEKWCKGESVAKKDGKKAVAFETLTCEDSGMKWVEKMLKRAQDPSNDLTLTELDRVVCLMATKVALADTEQAVAEALQA